jgi:hypothetical protein
MAVQFSRWKDLARICHYRAPQPANGMTASQLYPPRIRGRERYSPGIADPWSGRLPD